MRIVYEAVGEYDEIGGAALVRAAVQAAYDAVPREHLRQLTGVVILDDDPKGANLGLYVRDHAGARIEIYLWPHVRDALRAPERARLWTLRLHLAHTLFHEVGHHMTLTLNKRMPPSRRRAEVDQTLEKWAEEYVQKRMEKLRAALVAQGGAAEGERPAVESADQHLKKLGF